MISARLCFNGPSATIGTRDGFGQPTRSQHPTGHCVDVDAPAPTHDAEADRRRLWRDIALELPSREEAVAWAKKIAIACRCAQELREFMYDPAS
jgi:hypothetical protein